MLNLTQNNNMKTLYKFFLMFILCLTVINFSGCNFNNSSSVKNSPNLNIKSSTYIDASTSTTQEELLKTVSPAVVGISAITGREQSIGTGVCVDEKSYILTNNHVVENGNIITLYLFDGSTCRANIVWRDSSYDLAILQASKPIPYLKMAESSSYSAGEEVIAIGTPLALAFKHSATKGIISATNRTIQVNNTNGESTLDNLIQHDASINPGNSGGPLINMKGEVLGINTVKVVDAEGMGFAIPVDTIHPLVQKISTNGFYDTAYMGVFGYDANLTQIFGGRKGYYVQSIATNSPAKTVGLQKGDTILKVNNVSVDDAMSLRKIIYSLYSGTKVLVEYERDGQVHSTYVTLDKHPCAYKSQKMPFFN